MIFSDCQRAATLRLDLKSYMVIAGLPSLWVEPGGYLKGKGGRGVSQRTPKARPPPGGVHRETNKAPLPLDACRPNLHQPRPPVPQATRTRRRLTGYRGPGGAQVRAAVLADPSTANPRKSLTDVKLARHVKRRAATALGVSLAHP